MPRLSGSGYSERRWINLSERRRVAAENNSSLEVSGTAFYADVPARGDWSSYSWKRDSNWFLLASTIEVDGPVNLASHQLSSRA